MTKYVRHLCFTVIVNDNNDHLYNLLHAPEAVVVAVVVVVVEVVVIVVVVVVVVVVVAASASESRMDDSMLLASGRICIKHLYNHISQYKK